MAIQGKDPLASTSHDILPSAQPVSLNHSGTSVLSSNPPDNSGRQHEKKNQRDSSNPEASGTASSSSSTLQEKKPNQNDSVGLPAGETKLSHISKRRVPISMGFLVLIGLISGTVHHSYYSFLWRRSVGDVNEQQWALRIGTALSFVTQISLAGSVGFAYRQWLWMTLRKTWVSIKCLDNAFTADSNPLSLLNIELFRKITVGWMLVLILSCLAFPSLITPATLSVVPGIKTETIAAPVTSLSFTYDANQTSRFAYSQAARDSSNNDSQVFLGPRTIIRRWAAATASTGEILPVPPPAMNASYQLRFYGPKVQCREANTSEAAIIRHLNENDLSTTSKLLNAYFAFVPVRDESAVGSNGVTILPVSDSTSQQARNSSNQLWIAFTRYPTDSSCKRSPDNIEVHYVACQLYNVSYNVGLEFVDGVQTIRDLGSSILNAVDYPMVNTSAKSDFVQHAYSAVMQVLTEQLVGTMSLYREITAYTNGYGVIDTLIGQTKLIGSPDFDVYFNKNRQLRRGDNSNYCQPSDQRIEDMNFARNHSLPDLIEELSFNTTLSLLSDKKLSPLIKTDVTVRNSVNLYMYHRTNLLLSYGLGTSFTLVAVILGSYAYSHNGTGHDNSFSSILSAARDLELAGEFHNTPGASPVSGGIKVLKVKLKEVTVENTGSTAWVLERESPGTSKQGYQPVAQSS